MSLAKKSHYSQSGIASMINSGFVFPAMARDEKIPQLRPVDELQEDLPVVRLDGTQSDNRPLVVDDRPAIRLTSVPDKRSAKIPKAQNPDKEPGELRTHQPGIEAIMDQVSVSLESVEQTWGSEERHHRPIPWGWFALAGIILTSALVWSLSRVQSAAPKVKEIHQQAQTAVKSEQEEEIEAMQVVTLVENAVRAYYDASSVDALSRLVRHPQRVSPFMKAYYGEKSFLQPHLRSIKLLQPITIGNRGNFWMATVRTSDPKSQNLLIELTGANEARIDWETAVCYQPMPWDDYVAKRPTGTSMDFRVTVEPDQFFSHEFSDPAKWVCYRVTALNSLETLFGYASPDSPVARDLQQLQAENGSRMSLILRLMIPEGMQSRRGVVIEKVLSARWLYLESPDLQP